jgi:hypothetical protein
MLLARSALECAPPRGLPLCRGRQGQLAGRAGEWQEAVALAAEILHWAEKQLKGAQR